MASWTIIQISRDGVVWLCTQCEYVTAQLNEQRREVCECTNLKKT